MRGFHVAEDSNLSARALTPGNRVRRRRFSPFVRGTLLVGRRAGMAATSGRIRAFDWLRGLAVLVMVETHALVFLRLELHLTRAMARLNWVNGLVAPSFILAAGFSLGLLQVRAAALGRGGQSARLWRTLRRIGEVLAVATLVNVVWFPISVEPRWLTRIDILQCIGLSLLLALPLLFLLARRPSLLASVCLVVAGAIFFLAPYTAWVTGSVATQLLRREGPWSTVFPLVPWSGYIFLGAALGALLAAGELPQVRWLLLALAGVGLLIALLTPVWLAVYPPHEFWVTDPSNSAQRWTVVAALLLGLLALEARIPERWRVRAPVRFVELFGTSSLAAYFFHEMLLFYQVRGVSLDVLFGRRCGWWAYAALTGCVIGVTAVLTALTDRVYRALDNRTHLPAVALPPPQPGG
ncbi:MAG: heparan-alpha-glucosaminide N-acetyltransferase domain-containing protein [Myxococcaceae bacterium]